MYGMTFTVQEIKKKKKKVKKKENFFSEDL